VRDFVDTLLAPGRVVSLAQTLIKLTAPGVPDIYQGTELWTHTLVDPDNRRPVDYGLRRRLLAEIGDRASPEQVLARADEGLPKLWVIQRALRARPEGRYEPLAATGPHAEHVLAFGRGGTLITVVPRLAQGLRGGWGDTTLALPDGTWRNAFTDDQHHGRESLGHLFARFPVALLIRELV
jgi:(1->4)-alpha-D-glucan 1-alpha-D-glucosylmutase